MKEEVSLSRFIDGFKERGRENQFSYNGKKVLFDYLCDLEEDIGTPIELDVIALCCEYTEYESVKDYLNEHNTDLEEKDYDTEEEFFEAVKEEITEKTTLIEVDDEAFIIGDY